MHGITGIYRRTDVNNAAVCKETAVFLKLAVHCFYQKSTQSQSSSQLFYASLMNGSSKISFPASEINYPVLFHDQQAVWWTQKELDLTKCRWDKGKEGYHVLKEVGLLKQPEYASCQVANQALPQRSPKPIGSTNSSCWTRILNRTRPRAFFKVDLDWGGLKIADTLQADCKASSQPLPSSRSHECKVALGHPSTLKVSRNFNALFSKTLHGPSLHAAWCGNRIQQIRNEQNPGNLPESTVSCQRWVIRMIGSHWRKPEISSETVTDCGAKILD